MTMTKLERATRRVIREWCETTKGRTIEKFYDVFPRAYVVARLGCDYLCIACPPMDNKGLADMDPLADGSEICTTFDDSLKVGDWCSVANVKTDKWTSMIAIPAVVVEDRNDPA